MSSLSSLADASSGAGEELSVLSAGARRGQLFQISTEVKRWQDSVMHLSAVATGKDEALSWERDRNAQLELELEEAGNAVVARDLELSALQLERDEARKQIAGLQSELQEVLETCSGMESRVLRLEKSRQQAEEQLFRIRQQSAKWRNGADRQSSQHQQIADDLCAQLREMQHHVQSARADRKDALLWAHSLHTANEELALNSKREVERSLYLQKEVDRLASACHENLSIQSQMHQQIQSQTIQIEILGVRLENNASATPDDAKQAERLQELAECDKNDRVLLHHQLVECLGQYSQACVHRQLLVTFVEEASVVLSEITALVVVAKEELKQSPARHNDVRAWHALLVQKQRDLEYALDKQLLLTREADEAKTAAREAALAHEKTGIGHRGGTGAGQTAGRNPNLEARLEEMERGMSCKDAELSRVCKELEEAQRGIQALKDEAAVSHKALETEQLAALDLRRRQSEEWRARLEEARTCAREAQERCKNGECNSAQMLQAQLKGQIEREEMWSRAREERCQRDLQQAQEAADTVSAKLRHKVERRQAAEDKCEHSCDQSWCETSGTPTSKLRQRCAPGARDKTDAETCANDAQGERTAGDETQVVAVCAGRCSLQEQVEDLQVRLVDAVEAQVEAARQAHDARAHFACQQALLEDGEKTLALVEEALYMAEHELELSRDEMVDMRCRSRPAHPSVASASARQGDGRAASDDDSSIAEDIVIDMACDGSCELAATLRGTVLEAEREIQRLHLQLQEEKAGRETETLERQRQSAHGEKLEHRLALLARGEHDNSQEDACDGTCEPAQGLRQQLLVTAARSDDAELENEVLSRKLDLCRNELQAIRVKFQIPASFFSSEDD